MNGTPRPGRERREGDDIYQLHPIPNIPSQISRPQASGDSMLAYTERMRQISKVRTDSAADDTDPTSPTALEIQAQHIPKIAPGQMKHGNRRPLQRRPRSLDELIGRRGKHEEPSTISGTRRSDRCMSEPVVIPKSVAVSSQRDKDDKRIRINFVSTADLFDLVDFSLRSKRSDHVDVARAEDTLRLIREVNLFRSMSSRRRMKSWVEKESEMDRASLVVHGTPSPRESSRDSRVVKGEKGGDCARTEIPSNVDLEDSDDEGEENDENKINLDFDLLQEKRRMLLQPPKLHFRPKRAKRMMIHRSLLSSIPEDELAQRLAHPIPLSEDRSVPIFPSLSSLTAIKGNKQPETLLSSPTGIQTATDILDIGIEKECADICLSHSETASNKENRPKKKQRHNKYEGGTENSSQSHPSGSMQKEQADKVREDHLLSSKKKDTPGRTIPGLKTSPLKGRTILPQASDTRQKRIRKIIFLRDLP